MPKLSSRARIWILIIVVTLIIFGLPLLTLIIPEPF